MRKSLLITVAALIGCSAGVATGSARAAQATNCSPGYPTCWFSAECETGVCKQWSCRGMICNSHNSELYSCFRCQAIGE